MAKSIKYIYLVYCNPVNPLVYAIFKNKKRAISYADDLINYRFKRAHDKKITFGFYHQFKESAKETLFDVRSKLIYSVCLKIKDNLSEKITDDGCLIQVVRRELI